MAINKVVFGENTLLDLTDTTAVETDVANGKKFHKNDGTLATGTATGSWKLIGSEEFEVSTTQTSASNVGDIYVDSSYITKDKILYVRVRDEAGKRNGYFTGSDCFFVNFQKANDSTNELSVGGRIITRYLNDNTYNQYIGANSNGYGVYASSIFSNGRINISKR